MIYNLFVFIVVFEAYSICSLKYKSIHIGSVFPMSGDWAGGIMCRPAAMLALDDINSQTKILPNFNLSLTFGDSKCVAGRGTKHLYEQIYKPPVKSVFLTGCSTVTTLIAEVAPRWNLVVVSFGSSSPALSNRARFPSFFRTHPSALLQNPARIKLLQHFNWSKVSLIWEMEEVFSSTISDFLRLAKSTNISIIDRQPIQNDQQAISIAIKSLVKVDARIIVGLFYEKLAIKVMCEAYQQGLYGPKHVWIIIGWYPDDWWTTTSDGEPGGAINCTVDEMRQVVEGHLTTESLMWNQDRVETDLGITAGNFRSRLVERLKFNNPHTYRDINLRLLTKLPGFPEAPLAYDAVWSIALALDKAEKRLNTQGRSIAEFEYHSQPNFVFKEILQAMNETNFIGVSTSVYFDSSGSRISWIKIEQMINGSYQLVGHHHILSDNFTIRSNPVWQKNKVPRDSIVVFHERMVVNTTLFLLSTLLIGLLMVTVTTILLYFHRNRIYHLWEFSMNSCKTLICFKNAMSDSSSVDITVEVEKVPNPLASSINQLNMCYYIGYMLVMSGIVVFGADRSRFLEINNKHTFQITCQFKVLLLSMGFSFGYGSLFVSVWRIYKRATRHKKSISSSNQQTIDEDTLQSTITITNDDVIISNYNGDKSSTNNNAYETCVTVVIMAFIDILISVIWHLIDPLTRLKVEYSKKIDAVDEDIHFYPYSEVCMCKHLSVWLGIIFGWKGLLLILGLLLAYETRNIKVVNIKQFRMIQLAIYNTVVFCSIIAPLSVIIQSHTSAYFVFVAIGTFLCSNISLVLIFLPNLNSNLNNNAIDLIEVPVLKSPSIIGAVTSSIIDESNCERPLSNCGDKGISSSEIINKVTMSERQELELEINKIEAEICELRHRFNERHNNSSTSVATNRTRLSTTDELESPSKSQVIKNKNYHETSIIHPKQDITNNSRHSRCYLSRPSSSYAAELSSCKESTSGVFCD